MRGGTLTRIAMTLAAVLAMTAQAPAGPPASSFSDRWRDVPAAPGPAKPKSTAAEPAKSKLAKPPVSLPQALYLIRSTLLTLNDANHSGNYTVLRDLAAPAFQAKNTPADLSQSFANLRGRKFDLYAAALIAPKLSAPPRRERNGLLRLTGHFPTRPLQINFDLLFQEVDRRWRLFGLSVSTPKAPPRRKVQARKLNRRK